MTNIEFVKRAKKALTVKTLYVKGGIGYPLTDVGKAMTKFYEFNTLSPRKEKIAAADGNTFAFDCVCFVKSILWGWDGNPNKLYGGAKYNGTKTKDVGYDNLYHNYCVEHSTDFSKIEIGEFLIMNNHCGIYIGNDEVIEGTLSAEGDGVVVSKLFARRDGSKWVGHAKIKELTYLKPEIPKAEKITITIPKSLKDYVNIEVK